MKWQSSKDQRPLEFASQTEKRDERPTRSNQWGTPLGDKRVVKVSDAGWGAGGRNKHTVAGSTLGKCGNRTSCRGECRRIAESTEGPFLEVVQSWNLNTLLQSSPNQAPAAIIEAAARDRERALQSD